MKKNYLAAICMIVAIATIFWSVGVATDFFASKAFSSFWWLSYGGAHFAEFVALSIGGVALLLGINFWMIRERKS